MKPLLKIENISKSFGEKKVLKNLSLNLFQGDILGLIGKSGCGKSTLLKILVGYYRPKGGKILFNEKDITKNKNLIKKTIGYTTQENAFYEKLTVLENMHYYARLFGLQRKGLKKYINTLLQSVDILHAKNTLAGDISGGMKRRLDFVISILHKPDLIVLDEPTTGLDPLLMEQFWKIVSKITKKEKKTLIMTSHTLTEIQKHCTKAAIMKDGKIGKIIDLRNKKINLEREFRKFLT